MEAEWYLNSNGKMLGPMSTAKLEQLFRDGAVRESDLVGMAGDASWLPAQQVRESFAQFQPSETEESPSHAADDILKKVLHVKPARSDRDSNGENEDALRNLVSGSVSGVNAAWNGLLTGLAAILGGAFAALSQGGVLLMRARHSKAALITLIVILLAILFRNFRYTESDNKVVLDQLTILAEEYEQLRGSEGVTTADWDVFQRDSMESLESAIKLLSESASRGHPLLQTFPSLGQMPRSREATVRGHLLEAGYAFRKLIKAPTESEEARTIFGTQMELARQSLTASPTPVKPPSQ